ncbi:MAG: ATP-binding protein [Patescibacteria group bacterium]
MSKNPELALYLKKCPFVKHNFPVWLSQGLKIPFSCMIKEMEAFKIPFLISYFFTFVSAAVVALFLLFTAYRKDRAARGFANLSLALAGYAIFLFFAIFTETIEYKRTLFLISGIPFIFIGTSFLDFVIAFTEAHSTIRYDRRWKLLYYIPGLIIMGFYFSDIFTGTTQMLMKDLQFRENWFPWPDIGPVFPFFTFHFFISFTAGFFMLWRLRREVDKTIRAQINYTFWTTAIAAYGGSTLWFLWYKIPFPPIGAFIIPVYVFGLFYTITRFHLFNAKVITAELSTIFVWMIMVARMVVANNLYEFLLDLGVLLLTVFFGVFTIRSVQGEVNQKERLDVANKSLTDLNLHLEEKVAEQTVEVRKAYEVEKKARIELEELDKAKDEFILTTQHHLRTPLTVAKGFLQLLSEKKEKIGEEESVYVQKALEATEKMRELINDFLNVSAMKVGKTNLALEPISLETLVEGVSNEFELQIKKKSLSLSISFSPEAKKVTVNADKRALKAVFSNILDNAVAYTPSGVISIGGSVINHPIEKKLYARITITDTGIGIASEEIGTLFTHLFERGKEAADINAVGKGIGLTLSKNIIQAHGGTIEATSQGRGQGTTFTILLPLFSQIS